MSALRTYALRFVPKLDTWSVIGGWAGFRPGTAETRDYVLRMHGESDGWLTAAGIRSTGLSASLGIGEAALRLMQDSLGGEPGGAADPGGWDRLPSWRELGEQYHARKDGLVEVDGAEYAVSHPITMHGWGRDFE